ncbi:hypothetical protein GDO81_022551 [Engystomops pustulosus]|uniref:Uncharacterized protein n=1 Tax=Engystomops pustulosus TaxID=76066 RepID=A0AAV6YWZ1_ENGPU|nr:hypothetical protein GDO81_022551 [Engystomops pustulosus]
MPKSLDKWFQGCSVQKGREGAALSCTSCQQKMFGWNPLTITETTGKMYKRQVQAMNCLGNPQISSTRHISATAQNRKPWSCPGPSTQHYQGSPIN